MSAIDDKYLELGEAQGFLGLPTSPELITPNSLGSYRHYQGGSIYWNHTFPLACEVHGLIRARWEALGWENSPLRFPISDERPAGGGRGRISYFESGAIAWTPNTGAHEVFGAIFVRWNELNREDGLGFPLTGEQMTPDPQRRGRYNHFENGSIYWTPQTGAHEVTGAIKNTWAGTGWERGPLGYPVDKPMRMPGSTTDYQDFEHGSIYDWLGISRIVISNPTVVALSGHIIQWNEFGTLLPDRDRISVAFSGHPPDGAIRITLNVGPGISWWKAVGLWSPARGDFFEVAADGGHPSHTITIPPAAVEPGEMFLVFNKAKVFGIHTRIYWLGQAARLLGNDVTFTWLQDA